MPIAKVNGAEMYYEEAGSGSPLILSPRDLQGGALELPAGQRQAVPGASRHYVRSSLRRPV